MLLEILRKRRSIRRYTSREVEQEKVEYLIESMLRSPSSRSLNPWEFVVVDDPLILQQLSQAKPHGAAFIKDAPLAIVVCAHPEKCDVWIEDCSIASTLLHLAASDCGLGSCWIQIRLRHHSEDQSAGEYVADLLGLAEDMEVEAIVAIGYPAEEKSGHPKETLLYERVNFNKYGRKKKQ